MKPTRNSLRALSLGVTLALAAPTMALANEQQGERYDRERTEQGYMQEQQTNTRNQSLRDEQSMTQRERDDREWTDAEQDRSDRMATRQQSSQHEAMAQRDQQTHRQLRDRPGQTASDARREAVIWTSIALNDSLRATNVDVEVKDQRAILSGSVESQVERDLAEDIALAVPGIERVDNQIDIDPDVQPVVTRVDVHDLRDAEPGRSAGTGSQRDFGTSMSDATTTAQVKSKLLWNTSTDGLDIDVDTHSGRVTLTGTADSQQSKQLAERLARDTRGVVAVDNRLTVLQDDDQISARDRRDDDRITSRDRDSDSDMFVDRSNGREAQLARRDGDETFERRDTIDRDYDQRRDRDATVDVDLERPDTWITTKVKSSLLFSRSVDGFDIDVDTNNGVVRLEGNVDSETEKQQAVQIARDIQGVRRVDDSGLRVGLADDEGAVAGREYE